MFDSVLVRDLMRQDVITVKEDMPLQDAAALLVEKSITGCPVVNPEGEYIGVLSTTDIARFESDRLAPRQASIITDFYMSDGPYAFENQASGLPSTIAQDISVKDVMTPFVFKIDASAPIAEAARNMVQGRIHRLLVFDNKKIVGIITALDLLRLLEAA